MATFATLDPQKRTGAVIAPTDRNSGTKKIFSESVGKQIVSVLFLVRQWLRPHKGAGWVTYALQMNLGTILSYKDIDLTPHFLDDISRQEVKAIIMKTIIILIIGIIIYYIWSMIPGATGRELEYIKSKTEKKVKSDIKEFIICKAVNFIKSIFQ